MQKSTLRFVITSALAATISGVSQGSERPRKIEVLGHRGARASRPENTMPAFRFAIDAGADTLELDVQMTKDGYLIVAHDRTVPTALCQSMDGRKLATGRAIRELTLAEIRDLDCGSLKNEDFPNQVPAPKTTMPKLEDVFELVASHQVQAKSQINLQIEVKGVPRYTTAADSPDVLAGAIIAAAKKYQLIDRIVIQSFDHRVIAAAKKINPRIKTAALLAPNLPDWVSVLKSSGASIISPHLDWVTKEAVDAAHKYGAKVVPYTANHEADWKFLITCGVDGIITDDPQALIKYLADKSG